MEMSDLKGWNLNGIVTNVTAFKIVDIGVHQDGLVHFVFIDEIYQRSERSSFNGDRIKVYSRCRFAA